LPSVPSACHHGFLFLTGTMRFGISSLFPERNTSARSFRLLVLSSLALVLLGLVLMLSPASTTTSAQKSKKGEPKPNPSPSPPTIDFQATSEVDIVEKGKPVHVHLNFTNKSEQRLTISEITLSSQSFSITSAQSGTPSPSPSPNGALQATSLRLEQVVEPFQTFADSLTMTAKESAPFSQNKLILTAKYSWPSCQQRFESAQIAILTIEVRRRFEEEAKGLPGGTAAILYLLLPILPALFSYQLLNRRRKHQGWQVPTFGTEHILPAFFLAVLFSLIIIWRTKAHQEIDYSNYTVFLTVIFLSAIAGALIPTVRWIIDSIRRSIYDFKDTDCGDKYLLRALRGRHSKGGFIWAKGRVNTEQWEGILFHQLDGSPVLGAILQIAKTDKVSDAEWEKIKEKLFGKEPLDKNDEGVKHTELLDPKYLRKLVKAIKIQVGSAQKIKVGSGHLEASVVVNAVKDLKVDAPTEHRALVRAAD
jgi:hypothetical protein